MPPHDAFAALRERNYRWFIAGWLPASLGLQMQATALAWEIYERTSDELALGFIGLARALPTVLLALPAGQIVDLVNRRRVVILTQVGFALAGLLLALGSLAWSHGALGGPLSSLAVMYTLIALTGCARVFNGPSRSTLLPEIISGGATGPVFQNAIAWNSGVFHLAALVGPLLAGLLIYWIGEPWPVYLLAAAACLWFAVTAGNIHPLVQPPRLGSRTIWQLVRPAALLPGITEGVRHVWRERTVFGAIALDLFAVLLGGATALLPIYARDILQVGPVGLGALKAAPFAGALLMALVLAHRPAFERGGATLLWSVAIFGVFTILFGLSTSFWLALLFLFLLGAADNVSVVIRHILVNARTPDRLRGRVSAVNMVFIESSNELGGLESAAVARLFGPVASVVSGGVGTILVVAGMALCVPELRRLRRLAEPVPPPTPIAANALPQQGADAAPSQQSPI